jgi:predicted ester cyclase
MTTTSAKTVAREFWESWGRGDLDATWTQYVADDIVIHPSSGYEFTRQSWLGAEQALHGAFDQIEVAVLSQIEDGDMVATRWSVTARQTGEFFGVPSTGKTATLTGTTFDRVQDGKLAEHWAEVGVPQFLQQLSA